MGCDGKPERPGRRRCLGLALGGVAGLLAGQAVAQPGAAPQPVLTQAEAEYEDSPRGIAMCLTCTFFVPPNRCRVVEGEVAEQGWCRLFEMLD
jgi:hypothetical protein